ncbi:hypothetical protein OIV83_003560 [Microbotryomycetes sp. JL201]|nr:hypothetical protein OIV83_003560 [Microbotryomycetes sp. JL201]
MPHDTIASLQARLDAAERRAEQAYSRGAVENVFNSYMHLHNAFEDEQIKNLWVPEGTPGIRAQYSNNGVYTSWSSVMKYHSDRPRPIGKLLLHYTTTPVIEVADDCQTAKGFWTMTGLESGLSDPANVGIMPEFMFEAPEKSVNGKRVWTHWVWCNYSVEFLRQADGSWKIWHFRCLEIARCPYSENWITFAAKNKIAFEKASEATGDHL